MKPLLTTLYITLITVFGLQAQIPKKIEKINFKHEINYALNFVIDNEGLYYIYDKNESTILKFDHKGNLLKKIGSRGRGPGEFLKVSLLLYNDESNLIYAYDMPSFSIKEITTDGEFINQYDYPDKQMVNPFYGYIENDLAYLVFYGPYALSQNIVHETDIKKGKTLRSFYDFKNMTAKKNKILAHNYKGTPFGLHSIKLENDDILLVNTTYEDHFYVRNDENYINKILVPKRDDNKSYKEISNPNYNKNYNKTDGITSEIYRYIIGVAELDSTILVFEQSNYDELNFGYHIYNNTNYEYIGYKELNNLKINAKKDEYINAYPQFFLMAAKDNNIYFGRITRANELFTVLKMEF